MGPPHFAASQEESIAFVDEADSADAESMSMSDVDQMMKSLLEEHQVSFIHFSRRIIDMLTPLCVVGPCLYH